jgi:alpha-L-fucosidase
VNNRNQLPGDFATPEQRIQADKRAWETCMTMNSSWGYQKADDDWKTPKTVVGNLVSCVRDGGNYLLNIGPKADGSIPEESVRILTSVGKWMDRNSASIYDTDRCQPRQSDYATFSRKGNTLYMHVYFWPGSTVAIGGLMNQVKSAKLLATGQDVKFEQDKFRVRFVNLPANAPDEPVTTLSIECDGEPKQDSDFVRRERPRLKA